MCEAMMEVQPLSTSSRTAGWSRLAVGFLLLLSSCDLNSFPEDPLSTLPPEINEDLTLLTRLSPYRLSGYSIVQPGVSLVIEPGTKIIAEAEGCTEGEPGSCAALVVSKGAFIIAEGTSDQPIYFTTENGKSGDWMGIVINGDAPCNTRGNTASLAQTGSYCGSNPTDSSGVLRHVIVENAGAMAIDSSLYYPGSFAFNGVGNRTVVSNVYARNSNFNGFSMVGGSVDLRYALASCVFENGFGWYDGWQGRGQFWISQQCSDRADSGLFGANSNEINTDLDVLPRSSPVVFNFTLVGPPERNVGREGIELALGTGALLVNGIVYNHRQKGFWINDRESCVYVQNGIISLRNIYFFNNERDFTNRCGENELFLNEVQGSMIGEQNILQSLSDPENPNYFLTPEGLAFTSDPSSALLDWFEPAGYVGAVGSEDWTLPLRNAIATAPAVDETE